MGNLVTVNMSCTESYKDWVAELALIDRRSMSGYIRKQVADYIDQYDENELDNNKKLKEATCTFHVEPELRDKLKKVAKYEGLSITGLCRKVLEGE